jgi:hypothetical protein
MNAAVEMDREELIEHLIEKVHVNDHPIFRKRCVYTLPADAFNEIQYERDLVESFGIYHIKTNDTLAEIAQRFELDEERLAFVNNLHNKQIYFGSCLRTKEYKLEH